jgi:hypothetical protein
VVDLRPEEDEERVGGEEEEAWEVEEDRARERRERLDGAARGEDTRTQRAYEEVEEVEDLLRRPAVLGDAELDARDLDLRRR